MSDDLYAHLGVPHSASADDIRTAYRRLARENHPDVKPGDDDAKTRFRQVAAAYDVLSDDAKRRAYDEFGEASLQRGFDADLARAPSRRPPPRGEADFDFAEIFGFGRGARGPQRGMDMQAVIEVDLREAVTGGTTRLQVPGRKPLTVRIPPGADDGSLIRLKARGAPGTPPGDLVIVVRVKPHPSIQRRGLNLYMRCRVSLDEAYNGGVVEVSTFNGPIKLTIPPLSQPGSKLRLRGKGVRRKNKTGDLIVEVDLRLPDVHDDALGSAIRNAGVASSPGP